MLKSDLMKRYRDSPGYVGRKKMDALAFALERRRAKGVLTKSQFRKRLMEDLKHEI